MTEDHWKVVKYLRTYYLEFKIAPMVRKLCKETGFSLRRCTSCSIRAGEGRLQGGRSAEAHGLRLRHDGEYRDCAGSESRRAGEERGHRRGVACSDAPRLSRADLPFPDARARPVPQPARPALEEAFPALLDELLGAMNAAALATWLDHVIRYRAVQDLDPDEAVGFVFLLKPVVREVLAAEAGPGLWADRLGPLDARIDGLALRACECWRRAAGACARSGRTKPGAGRPC